jgi:dihydropteridine reductase
MTSRIAVIYGGQGALGRAIVNKFKASHWRTVSVDVNANSEATSNVVISGVATAAAATADVERVERECATLGANGRVDAVICVAGGWRAGSAEDNDVFVAVEHMTAFNLFPAISAAHLAARVIAPGGLFVLTGALAALKPQPGMLAYGLTKCATHYLLSMLMCLCFSWLLFCFCWFEVAMMWQRGF